MDHWCKQPAAYANLSAAEWKELAVPLGEDGTYSRCSMRDPPEPSNISSRVVPCTAWDYNLTQYGTNAVSEWNLVCDRRWLVPFAEFVYHAINVVWLPVTGNVADGVGRQTVAYVLAVALLVAGFASTLTSSFVVFVTLRIVVSSTSTSLLVVTFVLLYEVCTHKRRFLFWTLATGLPSFAIPIVFSAADVYRLSFTTMHLVLMVPTMLLVFIVYTVDESPAWLLGVSRTKNAEKVALRASCMNRVPFNEFREAFRSQLRSIRRGFRVYADGDNFTFCSPPFRVRAFLILFVWAATLFSVNVTITASPRIGVYATWASLLGAMPAYVTTYLIVLCVGVKWTGVASALTYSLSAAALAVTYTTDETVLGAVLVVASRLAFNTTALVAHFLAASLFPTTVRCTAVSFAVATGKLAAAVAVVSVKLLSPQRWDLAHYAVSVVMAFACIATEWLPVTTARAPKQKSCEAHPGPDEVGGVALHQRIRASPVALPKEKVHRKHHSEVERDVVPEKHASRQSRRSSTSSVAH
ncbi:hypothetical protein HPB48_019028 [Haemaphysalis longicornis]|uniref:Organic cation/carnitine transporter n=1 Tax=Haemaphysalis longicornis TaxID=44386 RepID=A0A9J6FEE3_HAELO|nr:hypothetical protein HPB48_019028 [Haemaphysalis longicornis]